MNSLFRGTVERIMVKISAAKVASTATLVAPVTLGRWGIQYDERIIDRKINQANEDHCGCCVVPKKEVAAVATAKNKSVVLYEKTEEYLVPYVM